VLERELEPYRNYRKWISEELDSVTRVPGVTVVSLNSTKPLRAIVNGRIDPEQLAYAARVFQDSDPTDTRIIVAHHHFSPAPDYGRETTMPGAREVLDALNQMKVELILGGHLHRAYIGNSLDVYPGKDRDHGIVIVQSGTTTSRRGRAREQARNSFNVVRIAEDHLEITHFMYFEDLGRFAPFSMHAFPRRGSRYFARDPFQSPMLLRQLDDAAGAALPPREAVR
jgi:3',5'-cyclic AMP phosphodiesterase CpdA